MAQLDPVDTIATKAFEGYVVRKDLVRKFKGQYPVPTYPNFLEKRAETCSLLVFCKIV